MGKRIELGASSLAWIAISIVVALMATPAPAASDVVSPPVVAAGVGSVPIQPFVPRAVADTEPADEVLSATVVAAPMPVIGQGPAIPTATVTASTPTAETTVVPSPVPTVAASVVPTSAPTVASAPTSPPAPTSAPPGVPAPTPLPAPASPPTVVVPPTPPAAPAPSAVAPVVAPTPVPTPPPVVPPTPVPPVPPVAPAIQTANHVARGEAAYARVGYNLAPLGYSISFHPGNANYYGLTFSGPRTIEIYVRPESSDAHLAYVVAHEVGHAIDHILNSADDRVRWRSVRGISQEINWWPSSGRGDLATPAGDFAECFAAWAVGSPGYSSWGSCGGSTGLMAELANG